MSYYVKPWGRSATFLLQDSSGRILKKLSGKVVCEKPFELRNPPKGAASGYPAYELITVDGMTEMIEHRKMEPIFYVTDDPAVWKQYAGSRLQLIEVPTGIRLDPLCQVERVNVCRMLQVCLA